MNFTQKYKEVTGGINEVLLIPAFCFLFSSAIGQVGQRFTIVLHCPTGIGDTLSAGESHFLRQYRAATFFNDSISADRTRYFFTGELLYPTAVRIYPSSRNPRAEFSFFAFIEAGMNEFELEKAESVIHPENMPDTRIMQEYRGFVKEMGIHDMDARIPVEKFESYVESHPDSYVALFGIISQTFNYDLSPGLQRIALKFGDLVKTTKGYQYFADQYINRRRVPVVRLKNKDNVEKLFQFKREDGKYTLLEFWFTGCTGCIPKMKYLKSHFAGLSENIEIITISTDKKTEPGTIKLLHNLKLPWENYWDYTATQFGVFLNLYKYPANLLIDSEGYTVGKDIDIGEISGFIK